MKDLSLLGKASPKNCLLAWAVFWLCLGSLWAQDLGQKDSLKLRWRDVTVDNQERLDALSILIEDHFAVQDPDSARYYGEILLDLATELENPYAQGVGHFSVGQALLRLGQLKEARTRLLQAIEMWESLDFPEQLAEAYNLMGILLKRTGPLEEAVEYFSRCIELKEQLNDTLTIAAPYLGIAAIYERQGEMALSLEHNQKALKISQGAEDLRMQGVAHICLANNYKSLGDIGHASEQYLKARTIYEQIDDPMGTINVLNNLSVLLIDNQEYEGVDSFLHEALAIAEHKSLTRAMSFTHANLGYLWTSQGQNEKGLSSFQVAYDLADRHDLASMKPYLESELGNVLLELGRLEEAEGYLLKSLDNSLQSESPYDIAYAQLAISNLYRKKGDWSRALINAQQALERAKNFPDLQLQLDVTEQLLAIRIHFRQKEEAETLYQELLALQDSVYSEENKRALIEQEYQYEYLQKAYQDSVNTAVKLAIKDQENASRRRTSYFLMGGLGLTLVFGLILWNRFQLTRRQKQIIEEEKGKLDEANAQLLELDRFKSRFFTNLSHEFRTPLTVIGGMAQQIQRDPKRWLKQGNQIIQKNVHNLLGLINQILDLRKLESGRLSLSVVQSDVVAFLKLQTESVRSLADDRELTLSFNASPSEIMMDFDPDKLLLIHNNLLSNAIKFTPPGGEVAVRVEQAEVGQVALIVKDSGIGISAEQLPQIFDRFYQADNEQTQAGEGTGIGLSLTKELVQFMEGYIEVESSPGTGTTFHVGLPITQLAPIKQAETATLPISVEALAPAVPTPAPVPQSSELPRLLIIEDNPDLITYLYACLEDSYQLLLARDGEEGIRVALEQVPDLILSDVMMPKQDGYEVCDTLKSDERTSHIPIILLTAKADQDSRLQGLSKGADAYLTKPFNEEELFVRLEKLLELRKYLQKRYGNAAAEAPEKQPAFELEDAFIRKVRATVLAHLDESHYRIEDLYKDMGMSRTQLHMKIKALTEKSPAHFVRAIRVGEAKEILLNSDQGIAQVAYSVGFSDPAYFSRVFTKEVGCSPRDWREQNG